MQATHNLNLRDWDTAETLQQRLKMVREQLAARDIEDAKVLEAMGAVPRHIFVPELERPIAYADGPIPIGFGQTISQPYIVALMTQALRLQGNEKVLEIGTGSGYQAAILAVLARELYTIERVAELALQARERLSRLCVSNVTVMVRDGSLGLPEKAPFDAIIVTAAAPRPPEALIEQLAEGGRMVTPTGQRDEQILVKLTRTEHGIEKESLGGCAFVPLLGEQGWKR